MVFYKDKKDLIKKISYYLKHDSKRIKIAKSGYSKYHKYMNNIIVSNYIMSTVGLKTLKKPIWSEVK